MLLETINSPKDVKKLSLPELHQLAQEIREGILNRDSLVGGHVGPNLGIVETIIALHYVFDTPNDKIVYDVSHQCYPHKMLTGRWKGFFDAEEMQKISGYTNPNESEYDNFIVGHTSTSVSLATGLAKARDLRGEHHKVIALIGDGSLSGGEALEGFSNAAVLNSNILIIVNDNEMSIAENHGGIYNNLRLLRETNGAAECNMFKAMGFNYRYVADGNNQEDMIKVLQELKDVNTPTVLHIHTLKGKGYAPAEENKERWHWSFPFDRKTGEITVDLSGENYSDITYDFLYARHQQDKNLVVISAGTPGAYGLNPERRASFGENYVDVGIAEEQAVAMSSALAKGGCRPVFMVYSSFLQRTYDQLSQDLALNNNPAVILVFSAGISGMDATHLGSFDIPLVANIPNIVYLAPTGKEEYLAMLNWGLKQNEHPVVIRVPLAVTKGGKAEENYGDLNRYQMVKQGSKAAVLALGSFFELGESVVAKLKEQGVDATLINPRYITGIDEKLLNELAENHQVVATLENGELDGGFGEKIASFYGASNVKVLNFGAKKEFTDRVPYDELMKRYHLTAEQITADIMAVLK
ncbi:MAG TPA: 1-deoxy-D-xylulose-5-phosphate synthase [Alphaproteobacteria bacterium]|nr:1-deoxy-D-xylulose-5-phosphate synthase [Alphaproteobacteria bacterium]